MELLKIELIHGDPPVLRMDGELDLSTADQLRNALEKALVTDPNLIVDLEGVTFFDAAGLRPVLQLAASRNGAGPLALRNASRIERVLELVGLNQLTTVRFAS